MLWILARMTDPSQEQLNGGTSSVDAIKLHGLVNMWVRARGFVPLIRAGGRTILSGLTVFHNDGREFVKRLQIDGHPVVGVFPLGDMGVFTLRSNDGNRLCARSVR